MADSLYELLAPHLAATNTSTSTSTSSSSSVHPSSAVTNYLSRLTTLSLSALSSTEPQALAQSASSNLLSLQALSSRSHRSVVAASDALSTLREYLPALDISASSLRDGIPELDEKALSFSQKYSKSNTENAVLDRRKRAMLLSRNVDRVSDILHLPTLLANAIASSSASAGVSASASVGANYSQALDLFAHIKRLQISHPDSALVRSILVEAEEAMKEMTSSLINSLRGQNVRIAAAIRTIGWLRRVAPELATPGMPPSSSKPLPGSTHPFSATTTSTASEGTFGYLFLTCRLYNLLNMLDALSPLRDLADQETQQRLQRQQSPTSSEPRSTPTSIPRKPSTYNHTAFTGQQTERYLKRYLEIFREQSFAAISMYKNIFPTETPTTGPSPKSSSTPLPSPLLTFPSHLLSLLASTLQTYLANLTDPSARDSLLMQVLFAAGSLGRHGADFSLIIADLFDQDNADDDNEDDATAAHEESAENQARGTEDDDLEVDLEEDAKGSSPPTAPGQAAAQTTNTTATIITAENQAHSHAHHHPESRKQQPVPHWAAIIAKHRLQSSRLEALSGAATAAAAGVPSGGIVPRGEAAAVG